jgi:hypothetical protein
VPTLGIGKMGGNSPARRKEAAVPTAFMAWTRLIKRNKAKNILRWGRVEIMFAVGQSFRNVVVLKVAVALVESLITIREALLFSCFSFHTSSSSSREFDGSHPAHTLLKFKTCDSLMTPILLVHFACVCCAMSDDEATFPRSDEARAQLGHGMSPHPHRWGW